MFLTEVTFAIVIGFLTLVVGILVKIIGFPDQFRLNLKRKSTKEVSTLFFYSCVYILFTLDNSRYSPKWLGIDHWSGTWNFYNRHNYYSNNNV